MKESSETYKRCAAEFYLNDKSLFRKIAVAITAWDRSQDIKADAPDAANCLRFLGVQCDGRLLIIAIGFNWTKGPIGFRNYSILLICNATCAFIFLPLDNQIARQLLHLSLGQ